MWTNCLCLLSFAKTGKLCFVTKTLQSWSSCQPTWLSRAASRSKRCLNRMPTPPTQCEGGREAYGSQEGDCNSLSFSGINREQSILIKSWPTQSDRGLGREEVGSRVGQSIHSRKSAAEIRNHVSLPSRSLRCPSSISKPFYVGCFLGKDTNMQQLLPKVLKCSRLAGRSSSCAAAATSLSFRSKSVRC